MIGTITLVGCCLVFGIVGYAIRFKKKLHLIAGYDPSCDENPDRTAYSWGSALLASAIVAIAVLCGLSVTGALDITTLGLTILALVSFMPLKWYFTARYNRLRI